MLATCMCVPRAWISTFPQTILDGSLAHIHIDVMIQCDVSGTPGERAHINSIITWNQLDISADCLPSKVVRCQQFVQFFLPWIWESSFLEIFSFFSASQLMPAEKKQRTLAENDSNGCCWFLLPWYNHYHIWIRTCTLIFRMAPAVKTQIEKLFSSIGAPNDDAVWDIGLCMHCCFGNNNNNVYVSRQNTSMSYHNIHACKNKNHVNYYYKYWALNTQNQHFSNIL